MFMRRAALTLLFLLAACKGSDERAPFTDSRIPPSLSQKDWPPEGWTWGLIRIGHDPPQRYGMAGPDGVLRGQVLILPGYGEAAEDYYRLASLFAHHGYAAWVLDGEGQGGSGRFLGPRDLGHVEGFESDAAAVGALIDKALPSDTPGPVFLIASTTASALALRRLQMGAAVTGLVLLNPVRRPPTPWANPPDPATVHWAKALFLGRLRARGQEGWSPSGPDPATPLSAERYRAWRAENPDLRMGGPSYGWLASFQALQNQVQTSGLTTLRTPSLILGPNAGPHPDSAWRDQLCRALPRCVQARYGDADEADRRTLSFVETLAVQAVVIPVRHSLPKRLIGR